MNVRALQIVLMATAVGCASASPAPPTATGTTTPAMFKIVGYFPTWQGKVEDIQWGRITHLNYAFVLPTPTGGLTALAEPQRLRQLVAAGQKHGVKVSMAIGGWNNGDDKAFEKVAADPALRMAFVESVAALVRDHQLDGIDMDWEYPDPGQSGQNFLALMQLLHERLAPMGKLLTMAVVGDGKTAAGIPAETFPLVDFINIMAYDADEDKRYVHHSPYEYSELCLDFWLARGVPREKLILGVPFFGKKPYTDYHKIVAQDPKAPNEDQVGNLRYNGLETIRKKTALAARKGGGIMIWELSQDTGDATSLLQAIREASPGG